MATYDPLYEPPTSLDRAIEKVESSSWDRPHAHYCTSCGEVHMFPAPKFRRGDRVRVIAENYHHNDKVGQVVTIRDLLTYGAMPCDEIEYFIEEGKDGAISERNLQLDVGVKVGDAVSLTDPAGTICHGFISDIVFAPDTQPRDGTYQNPKDARLGEYGDVMLTVRIASKERRKD